MTDKYLGAGGCEGVGSFTKRGILEVKFEIY